MSALKPWQQTTAVSVRMVHYLVIASRVSVLSTVPEFSGRCVVTGVAEPHAQPLMQCVGVGLVLDDVNAVVLDQAWKSVIYFIFAFLTAT